MLSLEPTHAAILRTLCFYEVIGYAPTRAELFLTLDGGGEDIGTSQAELLNTVRLNHAWGALVSAGIIFEQHGRVCCAAASSDLIPTIQSRDWLQPFKRRRAQRVADYLSRLPSVRFVALVNTTALGYARAESDLDFFVLVRAGTIWTSRLLGGLPFRIMGMMPNDQPQQHAICLSYWITDDALELASHTLPGDDPYFRYWFLSLLPLFDDGVSQIFWRTNAQLRARHPRAQPWVIAPEVDNAQCAAGARSDPARYSVFEVLARQLQLRWFPQTVVARMNRDTTVIVNDQVLKFHVIDRRQAYRQQYKDLCQLRGVRA